MLKREYIHFRSESQLQKTRGVGVTRARVVNTGASTWVTHRNTALGETKTRCAITAKDKEKPIYGFKNDFSASTVHVLQRCATSQLT